MTISVSDETIFVLSDEIVARIDSFFPVSNDHNEKTYQACAALQALVNVIGMVLCEMDCADCWQITTKAVEKSFAQMLKDVPLVRAEEEQTAQSIH